MTLQEVELILGGTGYQLRAYIHYHDGRIEVKYSPSYIWTSGAGTVCVDTDRNGTILKVVWHPDDECQPRALDRLRSWLKR
jgi:hypothetical protein